MVMQVCFQSPLQMKGKDYDNFDAFRKDFWKNVANEPKLVDQFSSGNKTLMRNGNAPKVKNTQNLGGQTTYQLHHNTTLLHATAC